MLALFAAGTLAFSPFHFLVGFLVLICVFAIVIIAVKYLIALTGIPIPPPLLAILGIIVFLILLMVLLDYSGLYAF